MIPEFECLHKRHGASVQNITRHSNKTQLQSQGFWFLLLFSWLFSLFQSKFSTNIPVKKYSIPAYFGRNSLSLFPLKSESAFMFLPSRCASSFSDSSPSKNLGRLFHIRLKSLSSSTETLFLNFRKIVLQLLLHFWISIWLVPLEIFHQEEMA